MTNEQIKTDINAAIYFLDEACSALGGIEGCLPAIQAIEAVLKMLEDYVEIHSLPKGPDIHGYVIVHKETGERWGQVFNSVGGAKNSYNSNERQRHYYGHDCVLWDAQTEYVIKPLTIWEQ